MQQIEYLFYADPIETNESSNHLSVDAILELGFPLASEYSVRFTFILIISFIIYLLIDCRNMDWENRFH